MNIFVISRAGIAADAAELESALTRLRSFEEQACGSAARWLHSYALRQADGRFGLVCVFEADGVHTLERHAAHTALPAQEIVPVAFRVPVRPFAPTRVYLIRRRAFCTGADALDQHTAFARRIADEQMARQVSGLHTYAVHESDGTLGTFCLYQAIGPQALRDHAERSGLPVDAIVPVLGRIVFREEARSQVA